MRHQSPFVTTSAFAIWRLSLKIRLVCANQGLKIAPAAAALSSKYTRLPERFLAQPPLYASQKLKNPEK
ncbi:MAG: hypothetical protein RLZZ57_2165 [Pseudomonadota bacterium]|jgi:hypothetical protein